MKKSWKTTVSGICAILAAVATAVSATFDNDPSTVANWTEVAAVASVGFGLLFARDNNVSSEQVGIK